MDLLVGDGSANQISDQIKDVLFAKSAENIEAIRPNVAASIFDGEDVDMSSDVDLDAEYEEDGEIESDVNLDSVFPFKNGTTNRNMTICFII